MLQLATAADRVAVNRIAMQVHAMHVAWRPDIYEMHGEMYTEQRFCEAVNARQLFVEKQDDVVLGYVLVKTRTYDWPGVVKRRVMLIDEICVDESLRGQGIGSRMMTEIKALGRAFGCTDVQLGVYPQNESAVAFYQKSGFTIRSIEMQIKL